MLPEKSILSRGSVFGMALSAIFMTNVMANDAEAATPSDEYIFYPLSGEVDPTCKRVKEKANIRWAPSQLNGCIFDYAAQGHVKDALDLARHQIERHPDYERNQASRIFVATDHIVRGEYEKAIDLLDTVKPDGSGILKRTLGVCAKAGKGELAISDLRAETTHETIHAAKLAIMFGQKEIAQILVGGLQSAMEQQLEKLRNGRNHKDEAKELYMYEKEEVRRLSVALEDPSSDEYRELSDRTPQRCAAEVLSYISGNYFKSAQHRYYEIGAYGYMSLHADPTHQDGYFHLGKVGHFSITPDNNAPRQKYSSELFAHITPDNPLYLRTKLMMSLNCVFLKDYDCAIQHLDEAEKNMRKSYLDPNSRFQVGDVMSLYARRAEARKKLKGDKDDPAADALIAKDMVKAEALRKRFLDLQKMKPEI